MKANSRRKQKLLARAAGAAGGKVSGAAKPGAGKKSGGSGPNKGGKSAGQKFQFYDAGDEILLVGEGDFSFAKSLLLPPHSIKPQTVTATAFDSRQELAEKYPDTGAANVEFLETFEAATDDDGASGSGDEAGYGTQDEAGADAEADAADAGASGDEAPVYASQRRAHLLFNVDATALGKVKYIRKRKFDCVVFNFPHTGSGITDQDRNILKNQQLLQGFLKAVGPALSRKGKVVVTLFEGAPYDLWNLKALAKAAGYVTIRSGAFDWAAYDGYRHRRTAGVGDTNKKAQDRAARTYVFGKTGDYREIASANANAQHLSSKRVQKELADQRKRKRPRRGDSDSDSDE
ncbi:uncharacterized protein V1510DRAFT_362913 [Dipodascopsis tothii]|uniref:uncharacterized protein n=1 Tax=Dipodascopsis tothii TaxID=44089 RepID=UPI0034CD1488